LTKFQEDIILGTSTLKPEEKVIMKKVLSEIPVYWFTAIYIMMQIFVFPLTLINRWAYAKLTEQKFVWQNVYTIDLIILVFFTFIWDLHLEWLAEKNSGMGLDPNPSFYLMYVESYTTHLAKNEITVEFYAGVIAFLYFIRLLLSLMLTKTLGPIISTILFMFNDIAIFLVIWLIILVGFTMVGVLTFSELPELNNVPDGFTYFFSAALGSFDLTIFELFLKEP